jgi:hypothetical protein
LVVFLTETGVEGVEVAEHVVTARVVANAEVEE